MNKKRSINRGRPPKYITDKNGREIVGISYHEQIGQFYITQSKPRIYLGTNENKAIARFQHSYPTYWEATREEAKIKDEIFHKALELLSFDNNIREEVRQIATDLVDQCMLYRQCLSVNLENKIKLAIEHKLLKESDLRIFIHDLARSIYAELLPGTVKNVIHDNYDRVIKLIKEMIYATALKCLIQEGKIVPVPNRSLFSDIDQIIDAKIKAEAKTYFQKEGQESLVWERAYDLIMEDPVKASKVLGIKEVAYLDVYQINEQRVVANPPRAPMPWWFVWRIYRGYADPSTIEYDQGLIWKCTGAGLGSDADIQMMSSEEVLNAIRFESCAVEKLLSQASQYYPNSGSWYPSDRKLPDIEQRLSIVLYILRTVRDIGFEQCSNLYTSLLDPYMH